MSEVVEFQPRKSKTRTIAPRGVLVELQGGGTLRVLPRRDNLLYAEKFRRLDAQLRAERGIPLEAKLSDHVTTQELVTMTARSAVGPVITEWFDFVDEDGNPIPCRGDGGELDEEAGIQILLYPGVNADLEAALEAIDRRHENDMETAEKN